MSKATGRWLRLYESTLNNAKAQKLPGELFKFWINCLCLASAHDGALPCVADVAFATRLSERKAADYLAALEKAGLLDAAEDDGRYTPHEWDAHQYQSDRSTDRVKRFRERQMKRSGNVSSAVSETPPDTDTDTETESKSSVAPVGAPSVVELRSPEARFYDRAKEILGRSSGGLAAKLLRHFDGVLPRAMASLELASGASDPRQYLGAIIANRDRDDGSGDPRGERGRDWG